MAFISSVAKEGVSVGFVLLALFGDKELYLTEGGWWAYFSPDTLVIDSSSLMDVIKRCYNDAQLITKPTAIELVTMMDGKKLDTIRVKNLREFVAMRKF